MDRKQALIHFDALNQRIVACRACPRLVEWREKIATEKRKSFQDEEYWGKAVPNFGDPQATGLVVGLAPAAHGANRTGRQFTGDRSGDWLYRALHKASLANQAEATHVNDGLQLSKIIIAPICHCAPPDNKPTPKEITSCHPFLEDLLNSRSWNAYLCLGSLAWRRLHYALGIRPTPKFSHGAVSKTSQGTPIYASFHPSQQNTFTGRLTEEMLDEVIQNFAQHL